MDPGSVSRVLGDGDEVVLGMTAIAEVGF